MHLMIASKEPGHTSKFSRESIASDQLIVIILAESGAAIDG